jgi:hypothetical protein
MTERIKVVVKLTNSEYSELGHITFDGDKQVHLLLSLILAEFSVVVENVDCVWMQYDGGHFDGTLQETLLQHRVHMCYGSGEVTIALKAGKTVEQPAANVDIEGEEITFVNCNTNMKLTCAQNVSTCKFYALPQSGLSKRNKLGCSHR